MSVGGYLLGLRCHPLRTRPVFIRIWRPSEAEADCCAAPYSAIDSGILGTQSGSLEVLLEPISSLWARRGRSSERVCQLHPRLRSTRKRRSSMRRRAQVSCAKSDAIALAIRNRQTFYNPGGFRPHDLTCAHEERIVFTELSGHNPLDASKHIYPTPPIVRGHRVPTQASYFALNARRPVRL